MSMERVTYEMGWSLSVEPSGSGVLITMRSVEGDMTVEMDKVQAHAFADQILKACPNSWVVEGGKQRRA